MTDYRQAILDIARRYARPGEDWESALFAGSPPEIDAAEVERLADWLGTEADNAWEPDIRHQRIAEDIRKELTP